MSGSSTVGTHYRTPYQRSWLTVLYSFWSVRNHGIPEESIKAVISTSRRFFSFSEEDKLKASDGCLLFLYFNVVFFGDNSGFVSQLDIRNSPSFKGYQPLLSSNNNPENLGDMHEGYEMGWEELDPGSNDSNKSGDGAMAGANVWPSQLPEFREAVLKY